ncbi:MAG TPA: 4-(cytidine 5'-diphospho)-2-C-methyl-D-erythritol kinase [Thermoanaerobaculia bacterium]|jgi:4-diphosphocytidyl-2-C-methyl-D-erythritol kinase|nr:4-(cytidine 5'-diphospho)-2-C-methyl-D-erythritol kinase [Thermoanaerobaculia bacterium]
MRMESYAKINWSLRITGRREDGFHDLETLFQTITLHDVLTFREAERLSLTCDDPTIPTDQTNLILRAARALGAPPVSIELQKRIPAGGGLGGGSSNAAATLVALSRMFSIDRPLHDIALGLGSDVPFFLLGGTAYATGRGEVLTPLPSRVVPLLLVFPTERVLTAEAFRLVQRFSPPIGLERLSRMQFEDFANDFEEPVFSRLPRLRELKERLLRAGAQWASMTGSGSTIIGAFATEALRDAAKAAFSEERAAAASTV